MRLIGLLIVVFVLDVSGLAAQTSPATRMDPRLIVAPAERIPAPVLADARRDHVAGAMKGLVLGAVVGGVGFAVVTAAGNRGNNAGQGYTMLAVPVGAVVGGAVGLVAGAIAGVPEKASARRS